MNDTFFKNFPSLNSNSKENRKYRQINRDYKEYLKSCKNNQENSNYKTNEEKNAQLSCSIFLVDERNQRENERRLESKRNYQKILQEQINEARQRKEIQKLKEEQEKYLAERRLKLQIAKLQDEVRLNQKLNPRISLSENEKFETQKHKNFSFSKDNPNHVYQYFSKLSPKVDSALFGYRRFFDDLQIDDRKVKEIPERSHTFPVHCIRCHKSLERLCRDCDDERISTMSTIKSIDNESFYSAKAQPFSFNYDENSIFKRDENVLKNYLKTYNQMTNYQKLYGDLRNRKLKKDFGEKIIVKKNDVEDQTRKNDIEVPKKDPLDDLLKNAQYTVITGYATSLLKSEGNETK